MTIRAENEMTLVRVDDGEEGADGTTFYPSVSSEGVISWTNDGEKPNPEPAVIKGPQGISLNSVTRYYKLSDTTPTDYPPSTGWQTSEPAYTPGDARNLYICDLFAWSNSTVTASGISLSSSYEAAKQAFQAAQGALTAANGKNTIFHQSTQPTGGTYKVGDTWFDTDDGYKMYTYDGTNWVAEQLGADAIADLAITNAKIADGTIQNAKIATIDAGKITTGTLNANRIAANSLAIGKIVTEDQAKILNSNVQVGGRNWLPKTGDLSQWYHNTTYVTDDDFNGSEVNLGHGTELSWSYVINSSNADMAFPYADVKDKQFTISFEAKVDVVGSGTSESLHYNVSAQATAGGSRTKYNGWNIYNNSTSADHLDTEYKKFSRTLTINDALFTSGSGDVNFVYFSFYNHSLANISVRNIKLELGNKATDWTPAPEDIDDNINSKANISIANDLNDRIDDVNATVATGYADLQGKVTQALAIQTLINQGYAIIENGNLKILKANDPSTYMGLTSELLAFMKGDNEIASIINYNGEGTFKANNAVISTLRMRNASNYEGSFAWVQSETGHLSLKRA